MVNLTWISTQMTQWMGSFGLFVVVFSGFVVAALSPLFVLVFKYRMGWAMALLPFSIFIYLAQQIPLFSASIAVRQSAWWTSQLGVSVSFLLDGLSNLLALLITSVGTLVMIYAGAYLRGRQDRGRFYALLMLFMASMLGIVLSDNLITLFVFWELTSFSSFLLIGFNHEQEKSRKSALEALLVTSAGGLAMLVGFILIGSVGGTYEISSLAAMSDVIKSSDRYEIALCLILVGIFCKSAQFPFHFWLPSAMSAPTPVSAYLHSATMVKAGIYLLARLSILLGGTEIWFYIVSGTGLVSMLIGAVLALGQTDLKLLLAYMTIMALGALTMLLGIGSTSAVHAAVVFLIVHSLYKGALFLVAGAIDYQVGTRDVLKLGSLFKTMPFLAIITVISALSMAGLPPLLGFVGKELVYKAALHENGVFSWVFTVAAVFAKAAATCVAAIVVFRAFWVRSRSSSVPSFQGRGDPPWEMLLGPAILGAFGLIFGLFSSYLGDSLIGPAALAIRAGEVDLDLHAWPQVSVAALLSAVSITLGILGYWNWDRLRHQVQLVDAFCSRIGTTAAVKRGGKGVLQFAKLQTEFLQSEKLNTYLAVVFIMAAVSVGSLIVQLPWIKIASNLATVTYYEWSIAAFLFTGSIFAALAKTMLATVTSLGVVGYSIALIYVLYGAPDLALTQIFIETLTIVIATLVIGKVPDFCSVQEPRLFPLRDVFIASSFGLTIACLLLFTLREPWRSDLAEYYARSSVPEGFGKNIVNVILVDFRAIDTLGEVMVIAVASLSILALLKAGKTRKRPLDSR